MTRTTIYVADSYGPDCPPHARPPQVGYGLSPHLAIRACEPWAVQAAHFRRRARPVVLVDGEPGGREVLMAALYGIDHGDVPAHAPIREALQAMRYGEAVRLAIGCGILTDPSTGRHRKRSAQQRLEKSFSLLPLSAARIADEAKRAGVSQSAVVDRLAARLGAPAQAQAHGQRG